MNPRRNTPQTGPIHRSRLPGSDARARRNAALETSATPLAAPFNIDRRGKQSLSLHRSLQVTPDNRLGIRPIAAMPELPANTTLELLLRNYNRLIAELKAKGIMLE